MRDNIYRSSRHLVGIDLGASISLSQLYEGITRTCDIRVIVYAAYLSWALKLSF